MQLIHRALHLLSFFITLALTYPLRIANSHNITTTESPQPSLIRQQSSKNPVKLLAYDKNIANAVFIIPQTTHTGHSSTTGTGEAFTFKVQAESSQEGCGTSTVRINGALPSIDWVGRTGHGQDIVAGLTDRTNHQLTLGWYAICHTHIKYRDPSGAEAEGPVEILGASILAVDDVPLDEPAGFTLSFRSMSPPELLHISSLVMQRDSDFEATNDWLSPSEDTYNSADNEKDNCERSSEKATVEHIDDLKRLEAEVEILQNLIKQKERIILGKARSGCARVKEELRQCDGVMCILRTICRHARHTTMLLFKHIEPIDTKSIDIAPLIPQAQKPFAAIDSLDSSSHLPRPSSHSSLHAEQKPLIQTRPVNPFSAILKFLAGILGLGSLFAFARRLRYKLCKRLSRADRQNRTTDRHVFWTDCWRKISCIPCHRQGRGGWRHYQAPTDIDEKQRLVRDQESILDADMNAQVHAIYDRHAVSSELQSIRRAHQLIDALVREDDNYSPFQDNNDYNHIYNNVDNGFRNGTRSPNVIAHPNSINLSPSSSSRRPSRSSTSTLPPYSINWTDRRPELELDHGHDADRFSDSDGSTAPPDYQSEADDMDIQTPAVPVGAYLNVRSSLAATVANGFRAYEPLASPAGRTWTPVSSIAEFSPRPSVETLRRA